MKKEVVFYTEAIISPHNTSCAVAKVNFTIKDILSSQQIDRSYFTKTNQIDRKPELGNVSYEFKGYQLLQAFGLVTPTVYLTRENEQDVLISSMAQGESYAAINKLSVFRQATETLLKDHFRMWGISSNLVKEEPERFSGIKITDPLAEASDTSRALHKAITEYEIPNSLLKVMRGVSTALSRTGNTEIDEATPLFFQHGDEIAGNFFYNPGRGEIINIDPSPVLSTRMERGLNKLLGGSLLFNFPIQENGMPFNQEKTDILLELVSKYDNLVNDYYDASGKQSVLKQIVFINLARVFFGIYNKENSAYFNDKSKRRFLDLAMHVHDRLGIK